MSLAFAGRPWPKLLLPVAITLLMPHSVLADPAVAPVEVQRYELTANQDTPELCFILSESVARRPATPLESFVTTEPAATLSATPRNDRLCLTGFSFGSSYTITLKAGLPGIAGMLAKDAQFRIDIPNRPPELDFATGGEVLPRIGGEGLPIRSVNVPKIDVRISRVADDSLLWDVMRTNGAAGAGEGSSQTMGEPVWQGTVETKGKQNQDSVTMLPIVTAIGALKPGLYAAAAWPAGSPRPARPPMQYFAVSDLGLTVYLGPQSLLVAARSLSTAAAAPGIDIALVADNNRELGRIRTDGNGLARFDSALLQKGDGGAPSAIFAYGAAGEFAMLSLPDAGPVSRPARADVALIHMDRARYRPGESVSVLALMRSDQGAQIAKRPLTMVVYQPSGAVFAEQTLSDQGDGSYNFATAIPETGSAGTWRIEARRDGEAQPIGRARFDVEETSAASLGVAVNADVAVVDPTQATNVTVQALAADGQQAANIPGEVSVVISAAATPFPAFPGFSFAGPDAAVVRSPAPDPVRFTTDATGKAGVPLKIAIPPKAMLPLQAEITARLYDAAGHPVERTLAVPIANYAPVLGVKAAQDAVFQTGQSAHFEVIAVSPDGARQEKAGAGWEILRRDWKPSWTDEPFRYRPGVKDTHIAGGVIDIQSGAPAMLDVPNLPAGRYRIEVFDPNGEAICSTDFTVGWSGGVGSLSDAVTIKPAKPAYTPGDGLDVFVKPPFEADVVLTPADPEIRDAVIQHMPAAGATVHLNLPRDAGIATRLLASAIAPADAASPGLTRRAFGEALLPADPSLRDLDVKLDLPPVVTPQRTLSIPVTVTGAGEDPAYVRVALTDERGDGLEPDTPLDPLIARQDAMVGVRDNYGQIVTPTGVSNGALAAADQPAATIRNTDPQEARQAPLALYSGIVALDKTGKGTVLLTVPDYAGTVGVRAQAWAAGRTGQAHAALAIRFPLNATLALPDYLMPDDHADLTLALDNVDGPRGEYRIKVHAEGAVSVQDEAEAVINLAEHEQRTQPVAVQAHGPGDGAIVIGVRGPGNIAFERRLPVKVRAGAPVSTRHAVIALKPGATLALDPALTAAMRTESLAVSAAIGAGNDLDLIGIANELRAEPANSAAQIVATATPYLAPDALLHLADAKGRLNRAAAALPAYQKQDGGFANLVGDTASNPWLTASVTDLLTRAKGKGATVPDAVMDQALDYLARHAEPEIDPAYSAPGSPQTYSQQALATAAYANKILAANGRLNLYQLRYFSDRFLPRMRSPVGGGLVGAAFADLGDKAAAAAAFARAAALPMDTLPSEVSGSDLRDQALLNAAMAESGAAAQPSVAAVAAKTASVAAAHRQFNAQEAAWLLRAGFATATQEARFKAKIGDKSIDQTTVFTLPPAQPLPPIKNTGDALLHIALTISGPPAPGEVKDQGYEVQRWLFDSSGKQIDSGMLRQGDMAVVVLTGRFSGQGEAQPVLFDPLPAGWTVEAASIADPASRYPWLKDLTGGSNAIVDDGLYSTMPRLTGDKHEFKVAYVIRATSRGQFSQPGTSIEDRLQPDRSARTAAGKTKVDPAS
ncbi:MAG TPA: MG2 domain-containing protein [Alphaproteobacteria bacterium]|jgi:hypothetical protein|nr:MG2 domain-containing protein [Alphaproteobacteria bacterium]